MRITPRKDEVKAIVALLEDDGYESAEALAKAIIKRTAELFAERDWYAWVWRENPDAFQLAWGPLASKNEADKLAKKIGLRGQHMSLHLYSTGKLLEAHGALPPSPFCAVPSCGHPQHCHETPRFSPRCWVKGCGCKKFVPVSAGVQR